MRRHALLLPLLATAGIGHAQGLPLIDFSVRGGYTWSDRFTNNNGDRVRLEGFEVGADIPFSGFVPGLSMSLSPSIFLGGATRSGADADGTVIRLHLTTRSPVDVGPLYSGAGFGWSFGTGRGNSFDSVNAFSGKFFVGYRLSAGPVPMAPSVELTYHQSGKAQLRGWTIGIAASF